MAARLSAATHHLLSRIRQFDEAEGWHRQGAQSCAHWLTWRIGLDVATAREKVRVARALGGLPRIDDAFAGGRLSYAQVRAITRVATPENEENLLMIALAATGAQLERICRRFRTAKAEVTGCVCDPDAATDRRIRARAIGDGMVKLEIVLAADEAELVLAAVRRARDDLRAAKTDRQPGVVDKVGAAAAAGGRVSAEGPAAPATADGRASAEGPAAPAPAGGRVSAEGSAPTAGPITAADALVHLAATRLDGPPGDGRSPATDRYQVVVHLERDLLAGGAADGDPGTAEPRFAAALDDGTRISAEAFRRVACDSGIVAAVLDEHGSALDIGRRTRAIPTAIRRALWLRDRGCRFPGCGNTRFLHGHHIQHWLHGGPTALANLISLCSTCHGRVHEGGFTIRFDAAGAVEVVAPDGTRRPGAPAPVEGAGADDVAVWLDRWPGADRGAVDAWTATSTWDGSPVDYGAAVEALMEGLDEATLASA